jgi:hypothetical protein
VRRRQSQNRLLEMWLTVYWRLGRPSTDSTKMAEDQPA